MWRWYKWIGALLLVVATMLPARAQQSNVYWLCTTGFQPYCPASAANPLPVNIVSGTGATVTTAPTALTTTETAVAPTATTFSSLLAASATRKGCLVQNTGTTLGYVYFGATGSATTANAFQVAVGSAISCATQTGGVLTDNVAGTCASSTCAFIVGSQ